MRERILLIDCDKALSEALTAALPADRYDVVFVDSPEAALGAIRESLFDLALCDREMHGLDDFDLVAQIARQKPGLPVILTSSGERSELVREARRRLAYDAIEKPFDAEEVELVLGRVRAQARLQRQIKLLNRDFSRSIGDRAIVAASDPMIGLLEMLDRIAGYKSTVLVSGEPGSGKEVIARAIHAQSPRREAPFVAIGCSALSEGLLDAELFGHAQGTLPGVAETDRGLFLRADTGTVFLDEVTDLSAMLQVKLLHVLMDEEIHPLGSAKPIPVDIRVIATSSRDLDKEVAQGRFRGDLRDRLDVANLSVPPLRERREDIPLLVDHFLAHSRKQLGKSIRRISDDALERLVAHDWPGNVRELANLIERSMILCPTDTLELEDLPLRLTRDSRDGDAPAAGHAGTAPQDFSLKRARQSFEAQFIRRALEQTGGNRTHAAKLLKISHRALLYKIKDYGLRD